MRFAKPALVALKNMRTDNNGVLLFPDPIVLSDHSRSPLGIDREIIERKTRTANGTLRKYHVTSKRNFSLSWENLPGKAKDFDAQVKPFTADGHAGAMELEEFCDNATGLVYAYISSFDDAPKFPEDIVWEASAAGIVKVMITGYSVTLNKRGRYEMYDADLSMEEV